MAVIAAIIVLASTATVLFLWWGGSGASGPVDLNGSRVLFDPGDVPDARILHQQKAVGDGHGRFQVPSVGLDVPLGAMNEVDGQITPPGFTSVYWVRNRGVGVAQADDGTVFVVTHSLRGGGRAPGNDLIDVEHGTAAIPRGTEVLVDGVSYTVDGSLPVGKSQLAGQAAVWANTPDRLVIITCLQVPAGTKSIDNLVITATRTPGTPSASPTPNP